MEVPLYNDFHQSTDKVFINSLVTKDTCRSSACTEFLCIQARHI